MNGKSYGAVILAAGYASRMGTFKPLLPIGGLSAVEHCIALFNASSIEDICVVLGHRSESLVHIIQAAGVDWCINANYHEGMFSSVVVGAEEICAKCDAFMVLPVDIPLVTSETILTLINSYENSDAFIIHPINNEKRGHPPLIASTLGKEIVRFEGAGGLKGFLAKYDSRTLEVPVPDRFIHLDMDTPDDYRRLVDEYFNVNLVPKVVRPTSC